MEPQRNSRHEIANEHQKNLAEELLSLRDANIISIEQVSFNERGIGIKLTSVASWETVGPQVESAIRKLHRGVVFNQSPW